MKHLLIRLLLVCALALPLAGCSGDQAQAQTRGDLTVMLRTEPSPPLAGRPFTVQFEARRADVPLSDARVIFTRHMPGMEHTSDHDIIIAQPAGDGRYAAHTEIVMGGRWELLVSVESTTAMTEPLAFVIDVEQP
jgi:hypothetical protein